MNRAGALRVVLLIGEVMATNGGLLFVDGFRNAFSSRSKLMSELLPLGSVKILQRARREPEIQGVLSALPEDCCSLGQTIDYYEEIESLGEPAGSAVLAALRDVTADEGIAQSFQEEAGFRESLLRFSEAALMFHERPKRLHREVLPSSELPFRFTATLAGFDAPHELDFHFTPEPKRLGPTLEPRQSPASCIAAMTSIRARRRISSTVAARSIARIERAASSSRRD